MKRQHGVTLKKLDNISAALDQIEAAAGQEEPRTTIQPVNWWKQLLGL